MKNLIEKGVTLIHPESTWISPRINPDRIHPSTIIHPGCRLDGKDTFIGPDCTIGEEAPATVNNCLLASSVRLKGGFFDGSVFLDGSSTGSSAHIRPGCILEEQSSCGHAVGLKQTILFPFATLGSLINFCDCLISGGTSRKQHSEVGSSFIHFNYTPYQDKATPSLFGNVPYGVMLNQPPVFLGGQAGVVGPVALEHGCTLSAGSILRKDCLTKGTLIIENQPASRRFRLTSAASRNFNRIIKMNLSYIGNIIALKDWYNLIRLPSALNNLVNSTVYKGAVRCLDTILNERIIRLKEALATTDNSSIALFRDSLPDLISSVEKDRSAWTSNFQTFKSTLPDFNLSPDYISMVQSWPAETGAAGSHWLCSIVNTAETRFTT